MINYCLFIYFQSYPICIFSGQPGRRQDRATVKRPKGFYQVGLDQLNPYSSYHLSFNLGYPNAYDRANGRTGNFLMVHGNCVSIGCYAMGDENIEEIYTLMEAALRGGQKNIDVHVFPFRFDSTKTVWQRSKWQRFWSDLKPGFDAFNQTKKPLMVTVKNQRYPITVP